MEEKQIREELEKTLANDSSTLSVKKKNTDSIFNTNK